jgi:hypothetical protein
VKKIIFPAHFPRSFGAMLLLIKGFFFLEFSEVIITKPALSLQGSLYSYFIEHTLTR